MKFNYQNFFLVCNKYDFYFIKILSSQEHSPKKTSVIDIKIQTPQEGTKTHSSNQHTMTHHNSLVLYFSSLL